MSIELAELLVSVAGIYAGLGLLFALWFVFAGVGKVDPVAREGTWGFRLLILPGTVALWPLFALRLARGIRVPPEERNAHRVAAEATAAVEDEG